MMEMESPTVLLIEDHEDTRKMLGLLFDEWGYQATIAPTATEGLKHLLKQRFDLIILDNWLPDLDGVELCRQIRTTDRQTPIIFYSAAGMGSEDREAMDCGANAFVSKGGRLGQLREEMTMQLKKANGKAPRHF
jgi:DNA-binding response OmpR family regulator